MTSKTYWLSCSSKVNISPPPDRNCIHHCNLAIFQFTKIHFWFPPASTLLLKQPTGAQNQFINNKK